MLAEIGKFDNCQLKVYGREDILDKVAELRDIHVRLENLGIPVPKEITDFLTALEKGDLDKRLTHAIEEVDNEFINMKRIDLKKLSENIRYIYFEVEHKE